MPDEQTLKAILQELRDLKTGNVFGDLPQRKNWAYRPFGYSSIDVPVGKDKEIFKLDSKGWLIWAAVSCDNPGLVFTLELSAIGEKYSGKTDITVPYAAGLTTPNGAWWCSKYDTVNSIYTITFSPYFPWPFSQTCRLSVANPSSSAGIVTRANFTIIELK